MKILQTQMAMLLFTFFTFVANTSFGWQLKPELDIATRRRVDSQSIIITWSESNDELRGFSNKLGVWETLKIEPQKRIFPVEGDTVGAIRIGDSIAAYSGEKGCWDVVDLGKDSAAIISADKDLITTQDGEHIYTFAAALGRWTSPTDPELKPAEGKASLRLNGLAYERFKVWCQSLPKYKCNGIRSERQRSATLGMMKVSVNASRQSWLAEAVAKLEELHEAEESELARTNADASTSAHAAPTNKESMLDNKTVAAKDSARDEETSRLIRELQNKVVNAENQAIEMGKSLVADSPPTDEARRKLKNLVANSFDARQVMQSLEAKRMRAKLEMVDENLASRQRLRDRIIERRVEELLEPNNVVPAWLDGLFDSKPKLGPTSQTQPQTNNVQPIKADESYRGVTNIQLSNAGTLPAMRRPGEFMKMLREDYERAVAFESYRKDARARIASLTGPIEVVRKTYAGATEDRRLEWINAENDKIKRYKTQFLEQIRDWKSDWSEYQSQIKFLRLDVEEAKANLDLKKMKADLFNTRYKHGMATASEVADPNSDLNIAEYRLLRVTELFNLYAAIETSEPKLNPDSFKPEYIDSGSVGEPLP